MIRGDERVLLYHPESDSYIECSKSEADEIKMYGGIDGELCCNVTGMEDHESRFRLQKK